MHAPGIHMRDQKCFPEKRRKKRIPRDRIFHFPVTTMQRPACYVIAFLPAALVSLGRELPKDRNHAVESCSCHYAENQINQNRAKSALIRSALARTEYNYLILCIQ